MYQINDKIEHASPLAKVDELMRKGEKNVTQEESLQIREIGLALQAYERRIYAADIM